MPEPPRDVHYSQLIRRFAGLALRNPGLVLPLLGAAWRFRARDWFRRPPFLPLPPADYIAWRLHTAYGDTDAVPPVRDLERYLRWSNRIGDRSVHSVHDVRHDAPPRHAAPRDDARA